MGKALEEALAELDQSSAEGFATDPDAPRGTFAGELHQARLELEARLNGAASETADPTPFFEPATELFGKEFPGTPWAIEGILAEQTVCVIGAEPKATKTWCGLEIAVALATETPAFGEFKVPKPGRVAVFLAEDNQRSTHNRLRALIASRGLKPDDLSRVHVHCLGQLDLLSIADLARFIASCRVLPEDPALVILDPLRDLHQAEENDAGEMAAVMGQLRALRDILNCSILFVHHSAKAGADTVGRRSGQKLRGSSAIHAAVDGGFYISNPKTDNTADGESVQSGTVQIELKGLRSAGTFSLQLKIRDDIMGEATRATWSTSKAVKPAGTEELERDMQAVLGVLRGEWELDPANPKPLSQATIRARVRVGNKKVPEALEAVGKQNQAKQVWKGFKPIGWVYVPLLDEKPGHRSDTPHSATNVGPGKDGTDPASADSDEGGSAIAQLRQLTSGVPPGRPPPLVLPGARGPSDV